MAMLALIAIAARSTTRAFAPASRCHRGAWRLASTRGGAPSDAAQRRESCPVGAVVDVVEKEAQGTGELTRGVVARHLTNKPFHPRGIKMLLAQSVVGRVFDVVDAPAVTPERRAELAKTANPHDRRRRGGGRGRRRGGRGGRGRGGRDRGGEDRKVASFTG